MSVNYLTDEMTVNGEKFDSKVGCWLCDGPHSFCQCTELDQMKSACIKGLNVLKQFQHFLLNKVMKELKY
jgi:hypothetical protein